MLFFNKSYNTVIWKLSSCKTNITLQDVLITTVRHVRVFIPCQFCIWIYAACMVTILLFRKFRSGATTQDEVGSQEVRRFSRQTGRGGRYVLPGMFRLRVNSERLKGSEKINAKNDPLKRVKRLKCKIYLCFISV